MVQRVKSTGDGPIDLVLDTAPVGGTLPDLVPIADGDPKRVLTISDFAGAQELGVRDSFHERPTTRCERFDAFPKFAQHAAGGKFTMPISATFPSKTGAPPRRSVAEVTPAASSCSSPQASTPAAEGNASAIQNADWRPPCVCQAEEAQRG